MSYPRQPEDGREFCVFPVDRENGGARRDRTDDLMLAKHALYQLSYGPSFAPRAWEGMPSVGQACPGRRSVKRQPGGLSCKARRGKAGW
jgi:hypothetical protein